MNEAKLGVLWAGLFLAWMLIPIIALPALRRRGSGIGL